MISKPAAISLGLAVALGLAVLGANLTSAADSTAAAGKPSAETSARIAKKIPGAKPEDVRASPIAGMYEVTMAGTVAYVSADGKYLIHGDLYDIDARTNLTEDRRTTARLKAVSGLKDDQTIIFAPATAAKHTITVFTDVDCGYCRKLHSEIDELNKLGIRVRYAAFPRSGPGSPSWGKMEAVWCAKDRKDAITRAKQGEDISSAKCGAGATSVAREYQLGEDIGVRGTPAILAENGELIGGYMPAKKLADYLDNLKTPAANN